MSNNNETRVLTRRGARELSAEEIQQIKGNGNILITILSVILTHTASGAFDEHLDE
ncbi:MAG TPA: hypothetical protein VI636_02420 [Candidatus Angelobacter sp.]